ncbi:hypothetical protein BKA70DRAFT_885003 [Coprinopsis sp. MPI-PUGE-AT-0042]|nr:hypothetical protein BKA70DRAFT_885003 [Coprinopsis sp. MPI-PUGE-AT-0042]
MNNQSFRRCTDGLVHLGVCSIAVLSLPISAAASKYQDWRLKSSTPIAPVIFFSFQPVPVRLDPPSGDTTAQLPRRVVNHKQGPLARLLPRCQVQPYVSLHRAFCISPLRVWTSRNSEVLPMYLYMLAKWPSGTLLCFSANIDDIGLSSSGWSRVTLRLEVWL